MYELGAVRKQINEEHVHSLSQSQSVHKNTSNACRTGKPRNTQIHYMKVHSRN